MRNAVGGLLMVILAGCATDDPIETDDLAQDVTCPTPTIDVTRSLAVTDPEVLAKFPLKRTLQQILDSTHATNTPLALYKAWMGTFTDCKDPDIDPNHFGISCRQPEASLATAVSPFDANTGFKPLAVMNRFDLAPKSGANCGEYRIVYGLAQPSVSRAFLIFEARMPNPHPENGLAGCAPLADFWAKLSTTNSVTTRANRLETLYYTGLTTEGSTFEPVVDAAHYGLATNGGAHASGQIRTNMFAQSREWNLREFKLGKPCADAAACALAVQHVTVKQNPANELFDGTSDLAPAFQTAFLTQIAALSAKSAPAITMSIASKFDEYESVSQRLDLIYRGNTTKAFKTAILDARASGNTLNATNILDRATTQTCAGCHELSNGTGLGGGVSWPFSFGFVQIDETSHLSPALTSSFLPARSKILHTFLANQCAGTPTADDGKNLAGGALDSPN
ncbi:MAG: hypothetical protein QM831_04130 [Kofleriaceae bacterium]